MLHVYYAREDTNKDMALYEGLKERGIVIVPEQYTLQAERDALFYLHKGGMLGTEIISFTSLGRNILQEAGGGGRPTIDRYGRHMLLARILGQKKDELKLYQKYVSNTDFIAMINDMISQMKQYGVDAETLKDITDKVDDSQSSLKAKLTELLTVYASYEELIAGKYTDTEDRIGLYCERLALCGSLKDRQINISGFDTFTPNNLKFIRALISHCGEVNVYLTYDDSEQERDLFLMGRIMMDKLKDMAEEAGVGFEAKPVDPKYRRVMKPSLSALEKNLFRIPAKTSGDYEGITLVQAANYYTEAATAAKAVRDLVRNKGYRYRDIALICNDIQTRGGVYRRVFADYDMDLFLDRKRDVLHHPAVVFISSILAILGKNYREEDVMSLLKTGLFDYDTDALDTFERYCETFRIRGSAFKNPFTKGKADMEEEAFAALETMREEVISPILALGETFNKAPTVRDKAVALFTYLYEVCDLPEKLQTLVDAQLETDPDLAQETTRIWNITMNILDQMVQVMGDQRVGREAFEDIFMSGAEAIELGLLPPRADGLVLGTMERTRCGRVKAVFVLGANEGILPAAMSAKDVLTEEEKRYLEDMDVVLCRSDAMKALEENGAIYRNLTRAEERLWISWAASDEEGKETAPSPIVGTIKEIFTDCPVLSDVEEGEDFLTRIGGSANTLGQLAKVMSSLRDGEENDPLRSGAEATLAWLKKNDPHKANGLLAAAGFRNVSPAIGEKTAMDLYGASDKDELTISPSRLEKFGRCPFAHFVRYGLHPERQEDYEVQSFDLGNLYHVLMQDLSKELTKPGVDITAPDSPWMTVTDDERDAMVDRILDRRFQEYRDGLMKYSSSEVYLSERIRKVAKLSAAMMIGQVRKGETLAMAYEVPFGRSKTLPPIAVETESGSKVIIEGKIDRLDVLPDDMVKIIDYKSGRDKFSDVEARAGWKLQLFLYMDAAEGAGVLESTPGRDPVEKEPVGAFYFHVAEDMFNRDDLSATKIDNAGGVTEALEKELRDTFIMNGVMVDRDDVVDAIAGPEPATSEVLPIRVKEEKDEEGNTVTVRTSLKSVALLNEEDFRRLVDEVNETVREMSEGIVQGRTDIAPRKNGQETACKYCEYKDICKFDIRFADNRYTRVETIGKRRDDEA